MKRGEIPNRDWCRLSQTVSTHRETMHHSFKQVPNEISAQTVVLDVRKRKQDRKIWWNVCKRVGETGGLQVGLLHRRFALLPSAKKPKRNSQV